MTSAERKQRERDRAITSDELAGIAQRLRRMKIIKTPEMLALEKGHRDALGERNAVHAKMMELANEYNLDPHRAGEGGPRVEAIRKLENQVAKRERTVRNWDREIRDAKPASNNATKALVNAEFEAAMPAMIEALQPAGVFMARALVLQKISRKQGWSANSTRFHIPAPVFIQTAPDAEKLLTATIRDLGFPALDFTDVGEWSPPVLPPHPAALADALADREHAYAAAEAARQTMLAGLRAMEAASSSHGPQPSIKAADALTAAHEAAQARAERLNDGIEGMHRPWRERAAGPVLIAAARELAPDLKQLLAALAVIADIVSSLRRLAAPAGGTMKLDTAGESIRRIAQLRGLLRSERE